MTMKRTIFAAVLLLYLAPLLADAQQAGEQLMIIKPIGWEQVFHDSKGIIDITSLAPAGQTAKNWTDLLTVEMITGQPTMDVQTVLAKRLDAIHQGCDDVGAGPTQLSTENGYDAGIRAFACPKTKQDGRGEVSLYKVFIGQSRIYVISRAWSGKPFEKNKVPLPASTTEDWLSFMGKVVLCDPQANNHPCPASK
jgi:hypothetical protein